MTDSLATLEAKIQSAVRVFLFLDYDGTLAEFAPTPDDIFPDPEIIRLLEDLTAIPRIEPAIISGRKLPYLQRLLPVKGLLLAGTYGIEIQTRDGEILHRADSALIQPPLQNLKSRWQQLIQQTNGIYLEDKGWSLALHAKDAEAAEAERILLMAESMAQKLDSALFRILGGHRFLEIAPQAANKGFTIQALLAETLDQADTAVYLGDDDKDEEAFAVLQELGGYAVKVAPPNTPTRAQFRLDSPAAARAWLHKVVVCCSTAEY
ncbi:MAG: trehalose-phosphatase [Anaerolineales bacterium]|nr:trehalose-phosphatase [Anaerolineales bacterium]